MPSIHSSAILDGDINLADDVEIGPHCVLTGPITIGSGTKLIGNVYIYGPLTLAKNNVIYPFVCLGFMPQHAQAEPDKPGKGVCIGSDNIFREHMTMHRAFTDDGPTTIGNRCLLMGSSHIGHDCQISDDCTFANGVLLGGHVQVGEKTIIGGGTVVHQFCRIGKDTMLSGGMMLKQDLMPYFMLTGQNIAGSINMIGLRRSGMSEEDIEEIRWVYKVMYCKGLSPKFAVKEMKKRSDRPIIADYINFIEQSKRGCCPAHGRAALGNE